MKVGKIMKYLAAMVLAAAMICSALVVRDGYKMYRDGTSRESLEDKVASIRGKENYTAFDELPPSMWMGCWQWRTTGFTAIPVLISLQPGVLCFMIYRPGHMWKAAAPSPSSLLKICTLPRKRN